MSESGLRAAITRRAAMIGLVIGFTALLVGACWPVGH